MNEIKVRLQVVLLLFDRNLPRLGFSSVQDLEEVVGLGTHSLMLIGFRALQMIVQVVTQHADQVYCAVAVLFAYVTWH